MIKLTLTPRRAELEHLLEGEWEFTSPREILAGIPAADASRRAAGCPHTIAGLTAHLDFWQQRRLKYARGEDPGLDPEYQPGVTDFPAVAPEEWDSLLARFLGSYADLLQTAEDPAAMAREVFDDRNAGYMLVSHASHNAYHLGQIVLLRRLLGLWPDQR